MSLKFSIPITRDLCLKAVLSILCLLSRSATRAGVIERVQERDKKPVAPIEDRLSDEFISEIVLLLLPLVQVGLHAKNGYMTVQAAASARDLAAIAPGVVVQPMLETAAAGLGK